MAAAKATATAKARATAKGKGKTREKVRATIIPLLALRQCRGCASIASTLVHQRARAHTCAAGGKTTPKFAAEAKLRALRNGQDGKGKGSGKGAKGKGGRGSSDDFLSSSLLEVGMTATNQNMVERALAALQKDADGSRQVGAGPEKGTSTAASSKLRERRQQPARKTATDNSLCSWLASELAQVLEVSADDLMPVAKYMLSFESESDLTAYIKEVCNDCQIGILL